MARHVVRLKLALLGGAWRKGPVHGLLQVFGVLMALSTATVGVLLAVVAAEVDGARVVAATVAALLWTIGPLVGIGLDETLDPAKMELLPLTRRQLVTGLASASAVGPGGVATLLPLFAFGVLGVPPLVVLIGAVAAAAQVAVCVLLARCVATGVARLLRTRRGRDALALVAGLAGLGIAGLGQLPRLVVESSLADGAVVGAVGEAIAGVGAILRWLPTSWSMAAVDALADGRPLPASAFLAGTAILLIVLARWWSHLLRTTLERPADAPSMRSRSAELLGGAARWLPPTPTGAAAARELRYAVAAPQRRIGTLMLVLAGVAPVVVVAFTPRLQTALSLLFALAPAALAVLVSLNLFAAEGRAMWMVLVTPGGARAELRGKVLAQFLVTMPVVATSALVIAALAGSYRWLPLLLVAAATVLLVGTGVGQVASVLVPLPQPDSPTNAFAAGSGAGCLQAVAATLALVVMTLALVPVALGIGLTVTRNPLWSWTVTSACVAYAAGVQVVGHHVAVRLLEQAPDGFLARIEAASP